LKPTIKRNVRKALIKGLPLSSNVALRPRPIAKHSHHAGAPSGASFSSPFAIFKIEMQYILDKIANAIYTLHKEGRE